ncbi:MULTISPECIES: phosphotransferase [Xanthomonas]|uniref:Phosphotransferase n=1 Tax=Xanthomonas euvesicatoria TaxID=456327 RepID=A0AAX4FHD2_XANEU|nr:MULTISPECIES: phosphotransferase [Xanthomonas]AEO43140.1 phosphotransferase [Xanthomonas euvesicatoria pv. citrumelo F1]AYO94965.1 aminoglycoside phosphotransferase [Xanthomonas axonopodis pv. commiphoreae]MBO9856614.1 phosphotransferase [Xanthomonas sp. A1809]MBV6866753.1 phosphotransferase [Xanthomonas campestris pv. coriandri]MBV6886163.1 phosphotransferase [Xanthomonas campestris pv. spermacoces]
MTSLHPDPARDALRLHWAQQALDDPHASLQRASVDAGFRSYWRTRGRGVDRILMDAPPQLENVAPWLRMHALLGAHGVRVPQVLAQDLETGFLLLEDLGVPTLAQVLTDANADDLLDGAIAQLLLLQRIPPPADSGVFGEALLQRDAGLFEEWFLGRHLGVQLDCAHAEQLQLVQRRLMDNALAQPRVFTHRDFMPRNLMPVPDGPAVLDFQDCVIGPIAYDPISLFKDTSVSWPIARVDSWLQHYHARAATAGLPVPPLAQFLRDADWMGVQRHLKNLGIFSRLSHRDGKHWYLDNVPRFMAYLDEVLPRYAELAPLIGLLDAVIKPALAARAQQATA